MILYSRKSDHPFPFFVNCLLLLLQSVLFISPLILPPPPFPSFLVHEFLSSLLFKFTQTYSVRIGFALARDLWLFFEKNNNLLHIIISKRSFFTGEIYKFITIFIFYEWFYDVNPLFAARRSNGWRGYVPSSSSSTTEISIPKWPCVVQTSNATGAAWKWIRTCESVTFCPSINSLASKSIRCTFGGILKCSLGT